MRKNARAVEAARRSTGSRIERSNSTTALRPAFDAQDRQIADYDVPPGAIDASRCTPGTTDPNACVPTGGWSQISGELRRYDGDGVPGGLTAEWYADRSLSGIPVARTAVTGYDSGTSSFQLEPPSSGVLADGGAVRITGALVGRTPGSLEVDVKGGSTDSTRAFVDGRFYGGFGGSGTSTVSS